MPKPCCSMHKHYYKTNLANPGPDANRSNQTSHRFEPAFSFLISITLLHPPTSSSSNYQLFQKGEEKERKQNAQRIIIAMAEQNQNQTTEAGRHQEVGHKSLLQSDALYQVPPQLHSFVKKEKKNLFFLLVFILFYIIVMLKTKIFFFRGGVW